MTIRIIDDEPEIVLTRSEHDRLQREWQASQQMTTIPQDFESWVRARRNPSTLSVFGAPPWKITAQTDKEFQAHIDAVAVRYPLSNGMTLGKAESEYFRLGQDGQVRLVS